MRKKQNVKSKTIQQRLSFFKILLAVMSGLSNLKKPEDQELFTDILDKEIRAINSDYDAKRYKDILLKKPIIHFCDNNFFYNWQILKKNNKIIFEGQNKVPRLSNSRDKLENY